MSKKPSRKKAPPATRRRMTFTITVEAQEMRVSYEPHWMHDVGHFEFRSPHKPARRIPVSETGYRSHFAPMAEVEAEASPQDYARAIVLAMLDLKKPQSGDPRQLPLFP
jgi:hypothetical protein